MASDNASLGKVSLWTSVSGIVLPVSIVVLVAVAPEPSPGRGRAGAGSAAGYAVLLWVLLSLALAVILELVALGWGIAARRTAAGKAGLVISSLSLSLLLLGGIAFLIR